MQSNRNLVKTVGGPLLALTVIITALVVYVARRPKTVVAQPVYASFGEPMPWIDAEARATFARGRLVALRRFTPSAGLGPAYNANSCGSCHEKPTVGGGASRYRGVYVTSGAKQTFITPFQHHFTATSVSRESPDAKTTTRTPPPFFGVGLLAEIPVQEIVRRDDPNDRDGDGVSGKVNFERGFIGRFGRKAQMSSLQGFVRLALLDHMGITTKPVVPKYMAEALAPVELTTVDSDSVADPELAAGDVSDLLAFVALLAPPPPDPPTERTQRGEGLFASCGCATCHVPALQGPRGPVRAYTDLLLHDMGPALADGVVVGEAGGAEFRTQPLWGLAAAGPYLHDGRADTIEEAVRAHAGEAQGAERKFQALARDAQEALLAFLLSLGGSDRKHDGLLPKDAPVPELGSLGGTQTSLPPADRARFLRGRELFDHDFSRAEGLGPRFNGDACRSCHFEPLLGGAGPGDVDVVRHGILLEGGSFRPPSGGDTMAHRFDISRTRPPLDPDSNLFERRQTPSIFGLGLVDEIPPETLLAHEDPDDRDGDGIRGRIGMTEDGRIGRFGWKAQQATLADFAQDALESEMGLEGELSVVAFGDLVFFLANLGPPQPKPIAPDEEARGRVAFTHMGCASCHIPELSTSDGRTVALFSDLLLHDVAPKDARLVQSRAFRTPPLWGIGSTAPYFHDGMSETLDAAIRRHDGEAARSRDAYAGGAKADRVALRAFLLSR
jgi:CxxC motif-containing protein (DUF1111 family)